MSSFRNYVPWKSNLSSYSASKYESKYSTEDKTTPRFGSISSPSTYRPSYSTTSGTYRSVPIKKDVQPTPTPYTSKYSDSKLVNGVDNETKKLSKNETANSSNSSSNNNSKISPSYGSTKDLNNSKSGSTKNLNSLSTKDSAPEKYGTNKSSSSSLSSTSSSKLLLHTSKPKKDEGPPITYNTRYSGSKTIWSRDPSPAVTDKKASTTSLLKSRSREPSPATHKPISRTNSYSQSMLESKFSKLSINRGRTRDRSPATESKLAQIEARIRSRESSPMKTDDNQNGKSLMMCRVRSRDPSPCIDYPTKFSIYRSKSRDPSPAVADSSCSSSGKPYLRSSSSISSRQLDKLNNSSSSMDKKLLSPTPSYRRDSFSTSLAKRATPEKQSSYTNLSAISREIIIDEPGPTYPVEVVTRGTSPNPPSATSSSYTRSRRANMAKTIEKTIQRPVKKPSMEDKAVQSDRMDDTTRSSKFANSSARISLSSYVDSKYSGNYTSRYSSLSSSSPKHYSSGDSTAKSDLDSRTSDSTNLRKDVRISREKSGDNYNSPYRSSTRSEASTNNSKVSESSDLQSKSNKSNTDESSNSLKTSLPPTTPRSNSISKVTSANSSLSKWANKDFRKSALNMGTPNQTRSGSKSSSSNDIDETDNKNVPQYFCERSPSTESDSSETSSIASFDEDSKASKTKASSRTSFLNTPIDELLPNDDVDNILNGINNHFNSIGADTCDSSATDMNIKNFSELSQNTSDAKSHEQQIESQSKQNSIPGNQTDFTIEYPLRHIDSDEHIWSAGNRDSLIVKESPPTEIRYKPEIVKINLHRIESGEKPWWLTTEGSPTSNHSDPSVQTKDNRLSSESPFHNKITNNSIISPVKFIIGTDHSSDPNENGMDLPLSARASPDGLEDNSNHGNTIEDGYVDRVNSNLDHRHDLKSTLLSNMFISRHTNIDDILGGVGCNVFNTVDHLNDVNIFDGNRNNATNHAGRPGDSVNSMERRPVSNGSPVRVTTSTPQCEKSYQKVNK